MDKIKDKIVLVTGASSGIGAETSRVFGQRGAILILLARDQQKLKNVASQIIEI